MLIGITGYAQHGKDTAAGVLVREFGFVRLGFADALKELAYAVDPWVDLGTDQRYDKTEFGKRARLSIIVKDHGWEKAKHSPEVRRFLQELGTKARDIIGEDVWIRAIEKKLLDLWSQPSMRDVVISDVRFPNEAEFIIRNGGQVWRVHRPYFDNGVGTEHPSESAVETLPYSLALMNWGTLEEFERDVSGVAGLELARMAKL